MKKTILAAVAVAILSTVGAMAQPPDDHPFGGSGPGSSSGATATTPTTDPATLAARQVEFLTQLLTLTTGQKTQAATIFTAAITANQALDAQETAARTALIAAVKGNNTADIATQCNTIGNIAAQRTANTARADAAFYALLTADQQTKLDSLNNDGFFGPGFGIHVPGGR